MGHPAASVAWLARTLHLQGECGPRKSELILSGGVTAAVPITRGDTVTAEIGRLGRLTLPVT
ncbi:hypothetical protein ACQ856_30125 (plasmid) [Mycolicibacterium psychrotolerans]|uniref:hypothetical protein n=1 Tax=Mycolicibacterium psychrotolerans TaxID=216929 RepID=UPI003D6755A6